MANKVTPVKSSVPVKKPVFRVESDIEDLLEDESATIRIVTVSNHSTAFELRINQAAYCCGMFEIGSLDAAKLTADKMKLFTPLLDKALIDMLNEHQSDAEGCVTYVAALIDSYPCSILREAFIRTKSFTKVKEYKNFQSGNKIEMWVSNN